jgi:hypothetical protein
MFGLGMNNNGAGLALASMTLAAHPRVMLPIIFESNRRGRRRNAESDQNWSFLCVPAASFCGGLYQSLLFRFSHLPCKAAVFIRLR